MRISLLLALGICLASSHAHAQIFGKLKNLVKGQVEGVSGQSSPDPEKFPSDWFALKCEKFDDPDMSHEAIKKMLLEKPEFANLKDFLYLHITEIQKGQCAEEWWIYTNNLGLPTHKNSNRYIRIIFKGKDGKCYFTGTIPFRRDYKGDGTYTAPIKYSGTSITAVDCEIVKGYRN